MKEETENNVINIYHKSTGQFGGDTIHIFIENTSYGALRLLQRDLNRMLVKHKEECSDHPVSFAYSDLLEKLSKELADMDKQANSLRNEK